ncbi:MAG TPA: serine/threonine protein kinase [Cyanobacteria bacterium UBA8553]|nr:serine/threonine protein kinase [Cyanobacteria bacterium UBA8553]
MTREESKEPVLPPPPPRPTPKPPPKPVDVLEVPDGSVALDSIFYVERPPIETRCYHTISQTGALIRIKAPRQMGKTSLLNRIVDCAAQQDYQTVRLNLLQAEGAVFNSLDKFLRWFCACVSHELQLPSQLNDYWDEDRGSIVNCTTYFEVHLLEQIHSPLVLALDEVDRVFQSAEIAQGFFPMLRSWHEEAKTIDIWEQLRLIVVHSTEDYGPLDINQSPFNVGLPVELSEFTPEQVEDLARRHKLDWNDTHVQPLMAMVGGHPYLVRLALYHLAQPPVGKECLEKLLQDAPTDAGIYANHLRRHLSTLIENPELAAALKQVVTTTEPVRLETMQAYKLYSMGLIQRIGDRVIPRCQLYQQYFRERLSY